MFRLVVVSDNPDNTASYIFSKTPRKRSETLVGKNFNRKFSLSLTICES